MSQRFPKVSIIGAGTVGSTLAVALFDKGYPIISIVSRTGRAALSLAKIVKCKKVATQLEDIDSGTELLLVTVPDDGIPEIASQLAKSKKLIFKKLFVVHCSGVHPAEALNPLRKKGAAVAAIHPIQSFPQSQRPERLKSKLRGIYYGIDGRQEEIRRAEQLVKDLGGYAVVVPSEMRPLYHIASVFASNYMMIFLNTISQMTKKLNVRASWMEMFGPMMTATMENLVKNPSAPPLTGPIVRGDTATIDVHLKSLLTYAPQYLPLYTVCGIEAARIAKEHGRLSQQEFENIITRFRTFIKSTSAKQPSKVKR